MAFPIMFIVIFGVIFSGDDNIDFKIGMVNEDGKASEALVQNFKDIKAFKVSEGSREDELKALRNGDRSAVIIIPAGTGQAIAPAGQDQPMSLSQRASSAQLEVFYDPANQNTSQVALNIIDKVVSEINNGIMHVEPPLSIKPAKVDTNDLRSIDYLLPGVLGMSLMQLGLFGTAAPLVSLREKGVLRRMGATPLTRATLLISQVAFRLSIAFVQTSLIVLVGMTIFHVHIDMGRLPQTIGIVLLGATTFITIGYFLAGLAKTEEAVQGIISLPNFLFMFLSGIFFPVDMMPSWMRPLVDAIPLTYLGDALRETMINAGSFFSLTRSVSILLVWLVVSGVLAIRFFKWETSS